MTQLVEWTRENFESGEPHKLIVIAVFVVVFLAIHPFQDGNGRLSRILTTLLLMRAGYGYVPYSSLESVIEQSKDAYYLGLRQTQGTLRTEAPDWQPWLTFFLRALQQQKARLEKKIERERLILGDLPELSVQILELCRERGRVTVAEAAKVTGANRNRFANTYGPNGSGELVATDTPENTSYDTPPFGGTSLSGPVMDYARFAQMLVNSGELDGARILSPATVDLMASNHLPDGVARGAAGGGEASGEGYGLGVRVVTDSAKAGNLTSAGTFGWSGAAGTHFFVDREEELIAVFMVQRQGGPAASGCRISSRRWCIRPSSTEGRAARTCRSPESLSRFRRLRPRRNRYVVCRYLAIVRGSLSLRLNAHSTTRTLPYSRHA
jgi:hypothetical protein